MKKLFVENVCELHLSLALELVIFSWHLVFIRIHVYTELIHEYAALHFTGGFTKKVIIFFRRMAPSDFDSFSFIH
jgi:hypothetical protein